MLADELLARVFVAGLQPLEKRSLVEPGVTEAGGSTLEIRVVSAFITFPSAASR